MSSKKKEEKPEAEATPAPEGAEGEVIENEAGPKKGKRKLIIIGAAVLILAIGAGLFFSGVLGGKKASDTKTEDGKAAEGKEGDPKAAAGVAAPVYYELPQFLVNLNSTTGHVTFLKMSVTLELRDAQAVATMNTNKPRIVDTFNTYLRELRASDIQGSAGIYHLRTELMARLNSTIEEGIVKDILFSEIIVQ